jgi:2',3'-cyclic-nucleotide 2'-phosphodiesterase (5'-nucleotidase family)
MMRALNASVIVLLVAAAAAVPVRSRHSRSVRHGREAVAAATAARAGVASFEHDVNIVHLTDVHSWLSGHMHEPDDEADYPDVLAFFQHLKGMAHAQGKDLFMFNSGDIVDGTGLAGATPIDGQDILRIIRQMPFAAITCGNHELYIDSTIGNMVQSGFIDSWKGRYIQGNIRNSTTSALLGTPYAHIAGAMGTELVVLGFLYNMWDSCKSVTVQHVELAVKEPWFAEAMAAASDANVSAIVILAHMHVEDPLVHVILKAIRATNKAKSVIFLTGHTHIRAYAALDSRHKKKNFISSPYSDNT